MSKKEKTQEEVLEEILEEECQEDNQDQTEGQAEAEAQGDASEEACTEEAAEEEDQNTKYLRLMADFQNFKRRVEKEKTDIYSYANEKLVTELLAVLDNFERALEHGDEEESFLQGMNNIFKMLKGVLEKSGLEEIEALGCEFDPNFHNAVMTEDSDEYESNHVSCVLQKGYKLNGKVIRPAMVKVVN